MVLPAGEQDPMQIPNMSVNTTGNSTAPFTGVELYALIAGVTMLLAFGLLGMLSSTALLLAPKCKSNVRSVAYGLPYSLAIINLLLCVIWVPVNVLRLSLNYCAYGLHEYLCFTDISLFYFAISTIISLNVFIVLQQLTQACCEKGRVAYVIAGIVFSLVVGVLCANVSLLGYHSTWDYAICTQAFQGPHSHQHSHAMMISVGWVAVLVIASISVSVVLVRQKKALKPPKAKKSNHIPLQNSIKTDNIQDKENSRVHFLEPSSSKDKDEKSSSKTSLAEAICPALFGGKDNAKNKNKDEDSDLDDDEFDQRMKFQVAKASSGRRHTVANIGFGESLFAPRNKEGASSKPTSPTTGGYQYVRKWSVDIQALQDQLENPKAHGDTSPFRRFQNLNESSPPGVEDGSEPGEQSEPAQLEPPQERSEEPQDSLPTQPPDLGTSDQGPQEAALNSQQPSQDSRGPDQLHMVVPLIEVAEPDVEDTGNRKQKLQAVQTTTVALLLLLVVLFCVLPFSVVQWLQGVTRPIVNRNISVIAAMGCVLQTLLHTFLIGWLERRIWQALRRLFIILTHWKCVCYCNIGKGKSCLEHPHYNGQSTSA